MNGPEFSDASIEHSQRQTDSERRQEYERFMRHLEQATEIVGGWPVWKQTVLGGPPVTHGSLEQNIGRNSEV